MGYSITLKWIQWKITAIGIGQKIKFPLSDPFYHDENVKRWRQIHYILMEAHTEEFFEIKEKQINTNSMKKEHQKGIK